MHQTEVSGCPSVGSTEHAVTLYGKELGLPVSSIFAFCLW